MIQPLHVHNLFKIVNGDNSPPEATLCNHFKVVNSETIESETNALIKSGHVKRTWKYDHWSDTLTFESVNLLFPPKRKQV